MKNWVIIVLLYVTLFSCTNSISKGKGLDGLNVKDGILQLDLSKYIRQGVKEMDINFGNAGIGITELNEGRVSFQPISQFSTDRGLTRITGLTNNNLELTYYSLQEDQASRASDTTITILDLDVMRASFDGVTIFSDKDVNITYLRSEGSNNVERGIFVHREDLEVTSEQRNTNGKLISIELSNGEKLIFSERVGAVNSIVKQAYVSGSSGN